MRPTKYKLFISLVLICLLSLITIWSTVPDLFVSQFSFVVAGVIIIYLLSKTDINLLISFGWGWYALTILLLIVTHFVGQNVRGSIRWIDLGFFRFQTSELAKPMLALFYSYYLTNYSLKKIPQFLLFLFIAAVPTLIVAKQPDLGSSLALGSLPVAMLIFTGQGKRLILLGATALLILAPFHDKFLKPYQIQRLETFINPYSDPKGAGYHVIQSIIAIGSGGLMGKGVRLGTQSHLNFLPERHTDFIFASFTEEFGLIGATILLISYAVLCLEIISGSIKQKNPAFQVLSLGLVSLILFQTLVNVGMNLGQMPVTGITLPFFSYGGSSLLSFAIVLGLASRLLDSASLFEI